MLDPWSLQILVAVGEHGSFSAAASALSLTQPAVSRQIAALERRLGVRLFSRAARGVRPTAAGAVAIDLARDSLARLRTLEARLAAFAELESGEIRLAAFPSANTHFVPEAIRRFRQLHPGVTLSLQQLDQMALLPAVRDGQLDLALVTQWHLYEQPQAARDAPAGVEWPQVSVEGIELVPLLDEELQLVLPVQHRLAQRRRIRLAELATETWIDGAHPDCLGPLAPLIEALGAPPRIGFWCDDWSGKQALVAAGVGVMLMPTLAATALRGDIVLRPTDPVLPTRRLYAAAATAPFRTPAVTAMLKVLSDVAPRRA